MEFYCDEPGCDCRRVIIDVLRPETGWSKIWATIGYGWESLDFYRIWGGAGSDPNEIKGPYLDPLNPQTKCSAALLNLFRFLIQSPDYVERLQRHYRMFRASVDRDHGGYNRLEANRTENRRKRLRDPNRPRRHRSLSWGLQSPPCDRRESECDCVGKPPTANYSRDRSRSIRLSFSRGLPRTGAAMSSKTLPNSASVSKQKRWR